RRTCECRRTRPFACGQRGGSPDPSSTYAVHREHFRSVRVAPSHEPRISTPFPFPWASLLPPPLVPRGLLLLQGALRRLPGLLPLLLLRLPSEPPSWTCRRRLPCDGALWADHRDWSCSL